MIYCQLHIPTVEMYYSNYEQTRVIVKVKLSLHRLQRNEKNNPRKYRIMLACHLTDQLEFDYSARLNLCPTRPRAGVQSQRGCAVTAIGSPPSSRTPQILYSVSVFCTTYAYGSDSVHVFTTAVLVRGFLLPTLNYTVPYGIA